MSFEKIIVKLDKLDERLDSVDKTLIKQESSLSEHMRRSLAAEENLQILREEFKPVQNHVSQISGAFKLIGLLSVVLGILKVLGVL